MRALPVLAAAVGLASSSALAGRPAADPRLREVVYDPQAVVTVPVKRGQVALVVLDPGEAIAEVAAGLAGDCSKPDAPWCVAAQAGSHHLFVKAKSTAAAPNNLAIVTDRRTHAFCFVVLPDADARPGVYRLTVKAPPPPPTRVGLPAHDATMDALPPIPPPPTPEQIVAERLQAQPALRNTRYSLAEGRDSTDIVPSLVFDDGRFTYLRFPGNREVPAVFHVLGDGSETLLNTRMEGDLLVVDRVSRRLMLRAGEAVIGIWNEAFDLEGVRSDGGTTVPGVKRVLRAEGPPPAAGTNLGATR